MRKGSSVRAGNLAEKIVLTYLTFRTDRCQRLSVRAELGAIDLRFVPGQQHDRRGQVRRSSQLRLKLTVYKQRENSQRLIASFV